LKTQTKPTQGFFCAKECNLLKIVATIVEEGIKQTQHLIDPSTNDYLGSCWNYSTIITTFLPNLKVTALQSSEAHGP
jgi:hypothetical protein